MLKDVFPWGGHFPPKTKDKAGNYGDTTWKQKFPQENFSETYTDGFATSAPVMSFKPNKLGIYDLGGNVWEWCGDRFNPGTQDHILRGGGWDTYRFGHLLPSCRIRNPYRRHDYGFRVVLGQTAP